MGAMIRGLVAIAGMFTLGLAPPVAVSTQHDLCLHVVNGFQQGQDAGNQWFLGNRMIRPIACSGEMDFNDPQDWYYLRVPADAIASSVSVEICPEFTTVAPWDTDLRVFFLPHGDLLPQMGASPLMSNILSEVTPGAPKGESHNGPGQCDRVDAVQEADAGLGRWYLNVDRVGGQGGYRMAIAG